MTQKYFFLKIQCGKMNHDLFDLILQKFTAIKDQINLTTVTSLIFNHVLIKKLTAISIMIPICNNDGAKIDDLILHSKNYYTDEYLWLGMIELNAWNNKNITDVNFLAETLLILNVSDSCGITQNGIQHLRLCKLINYGNHKINNVSFMADTLRILATVADSGIDQSGIQCLQLIELNISGGSTITNVNFMAATLRILNTHYTCDIDYTCIQDLQLAIDNKINK